MTPDQLFDDANAVFDACLSVSARLFSEHGNAWEPAPQHARANEAHLEFVSAIDPLPMNAMYYAYLVDCTFDPRPNSEADHVARLVIQTREDMGIPNASELRQRIYDLATQHPTAWAQALNFIFQLRYDGA